MRRAVGTAHAGTHVAPCAGQTSRSARPGSQRHRLSWRVSGRATASCVAAARGVRTPPVELDNDAVRAEALKEGLGAHAKRAVRLGRDLEERGPAAVTAESAAHLRARRAPRGAHAQREAPSARIPPDRPPRRSRRRAVPGHGSGRPSENDPVAGTKPRGVNSRRRGPTQAASHTLLTRVAAQRSITGTQRVRPRAVFNLAASEGSPLRGRARRGRVWRGTSPAPWQWGPTRRRRRRRARPGPSERRPCLHPRPFPGGA